MRIWQLSSVAWIVSSGGAFSMRTVNARSGDAACATTLAPSTEKPRLGIARLAAQVGEEPVNPLPDLRSALEAAPVCAHQAHQVVGNVDRYDVLVTHDCAARALAPALAAGVVNEERLDVGLHPPHGCALRPHAVPRVLARCQLDGAGRPREERERTRALPRHHEEREPDRDAEALPFNVGAIEFAHRRAAAGDPLPGRARRLGGSARYADALELAVRGGSLQEQAMLVLGRQGRAAPVAPLGRG